MDRVNYDRLSPQDDRRYRVNPLSGVECAIGRLAEEVEPSLSLEVGCGTGRWLPALMAKGGSAVGVDASLGMLAEALPGRHRARLLCGDGNRLPFAAPTFDLVLSVNAIHHLDDPRRFLASCLACLNRGGRLALVHYDPARSGQAWYVYDYFDDARAGDLGRFPGEAQLVDWMREAGLEDLESTVTETIERRYSGREVLDDYFLGRDSNSTLARLDDHAYDAGMSRLRREIDDYEGRGDTLRLAVRLELLLLTGRRPGY